MHEVLIAHLRECAKLDPSNNTYKEAADAIEELSMRLHGDEAAIAGMKREIERLVVFGQQASLEATQEPPKRDAKASLPAASPLKAKTDAERRSARNAQG